MMKINLYRRPLKFERLEDRRVLAPIVVTDPDDLGGNEPVGSLGWAIAEANEDPDWSEINFSPSLAGQSIVVDVGTLSGGEYIQYPALIKGLDRHLYAPIRLIAGGSNPQIGLTFTNFTMPASSFSNSIGVMNLDLTNFSTGIRLTNIDQPSSNDSAPLIVRNVRIRNAINGIVFNDMDAPFQFEENLFDGRGAGVAGAGIKIPNGSRSNLPSLIGNIGGERSEQSLLAAGTGNLFTDFATAIELTGGQTTGGFPALEISGNLFGARLDGNLTPAPNGIAISATSVDPENHPPNLGQKIINRIDNNEILYSTSDGIRLTRVDSTLIEDNVIGGNSGHGINLLENAELHQIKSNDFDSNILDAVSISSGNLGGSGLYPKSIQISANNYYRVNESGGAQPIDLGADGPTANDPPPPPLEPPYDRDSGPNELQNYGEVTSITKSGNTWNVTVDLEIYNAHNYVLEFYRYDPLTSSFRYIRSETKYVNWSDQKTFTIPFADGSELSDGERIGVVVIDDFGSNIGNTSELSFSSLSALTPNTGGPRVIDVTLNGSTWTRDPYSFKDIIELTGDQLRPIATQNVNTIQIEFSEHVRKRAANGTLSNIDASVLTLRRTTFDVNGALVSDTVTSTGFTYDPITHIATWTFPNLSDGKYAILLDAAYTNVAGVADAAGNFLNAEWNNNPGGTPDTFDDPMRLFTTGNETAGTEKNKFRFHFALLKGDYNGDGVVETNEPLTGDGDGDGDAVGDAGDQSVRDSNIGDVLPFRTMGSADLNDDEKVDGLDLAIWQAGYGINNEGDVDGDGDSDGRDFLLWQRAYGTYSAWGDPPAASFAEAFVAALGVSLEDITFGLTPQVINLIISSSISTHPAFSFDTVDGSGAQLASVPVAFADTISIVFSEDVNVSATSLILVGMTTANVPELADFTYDPLTHKATWRYEGWAVADNYLLYLQDSITDTEGNFLDGEWTNPASRTTNSALVSEFPSGDGVSGGNFVFALTLLPGDANLDGIADSSDYNIWTSNAYWGNGTKLFTQGDFNGDGNVDSGDVAILYAHMNQNLQNPFLLADLDEDGDVDDVDLDILSVNYGMANPDWADGDLSGDDVIDDDDLDLAFAQFGLSFTNFVA